MRNKGDVRRLLAVVGRLERATDDLERARLAMSVRELADGIAATNIQAANDAGRTWRDIGSALNMPFATLYRRYGTRVRRR